MDTAFDVVVSGAGPAGLCAALRLQQIGYQVLLLEGRQSRHKPRARLALGPGCQCMLDVLGAGPTIAALPHLPGLPTRQIWAKPVPEMIAPATAIHILREQFNTALLQLAHSRGVTFVPSAHIVALEGEAGDWRITLGGATDNIGQVSAQVTTRWLLDAGGRMQAGVERLACAAPLAVLWQDLTDLSQPAAMEWAGTIQLEACEAGWLWGMPLPNMGYRIMLLYEPDSAQTEPLRLQQQCAASSLFATLQDSGRHGVLQQADCTPYVDGQCWQPGRIRLGEAAFALDPASASELEKAMRSALQAAIALHTVESCNNAAHRALAGDYYRQHIAEICTRHSLWSARHYRQAWCHAAPFWQRRSTLMQPALVSAAQAETPGQALWQQMEQEMSHWQQYRPPKPYSGPMLRADQTLRFAAQASLANVPCVIENRVQLHMAIVHPHLERPLVFLENETLLPRLNLLQQQPTLATMLEVLGQSMNMAKAQRILGWLWQRGVLEAL